MNIPVLIAEAILLGWLVAGGLAVASIGAVVVRDELARRRAGRGEVTRWTR